MWHAIFAYGTVVRFNEKDEDYDTSTYLEQDYPVGIKTKNLVVINQTIEKFGKYARKAYARLFRSGYPDGDSECLDAIKFCMVMFQDKYVFTLIDTIANHEFGRECYRSDYMFPKVVMLNKSTVFYNIYKYFIF